ncbi:hypothetical protein CDFC105_13839 [Clostridioides difficile]|nr:hypothetical protein CDFC105_13839 [Clostridioides difficile]
MSTWSEETRILILFRLFFFFQAEDGIRDLVRSRGLGDVYKRQTFVPVFSASFLSVSTFAKSMPFDFAS